MSRSPIPHGGWTRPITVTRDPKTGVYRGSARARSRRQGPDDHSPGLLTQIKRTGRTKAEASAKTEAAIRTWLDEYDARLSGQTENVPPCEPVVIPTMRVLLDEWRRSYLPKLNLHDRTTVSYQYMCHTLLGEEPPRQLARRQRALGKVLSAASTTQTPPRPIALPGPRDPVLTCAADFARIAELTLDAVSVDDLRNLVWSAAEKHGSGGGRQVRAILGHVFRVAVERGYLSDNPMDRLRKQRRQPVVPKVTVRRRTIDTTWAPDDHELAQLLANLDADPRAGIMTVRRKAGRHDRGDQPVTNPKDVADLMKFLYATGCRLAEALATGWSDIDWTPGKETVSISGTLTYVPGREPRPTDRQPYLKTDEAGQPRTDPRIVPLEPSTVAALRRRAKVKGIDPEAPPHHRPIFETPQLDMSDRGPQWRDERNTNRAIRWAYDTHGPQRSGASVFARAGSHTARRWRATSWLEQGVPIATVQRWLGHSDPATTGIYAKSRKQVEEQGQRISVLPAVS